MRVSFKSGKFNIAGDLEQKGKSMIILCHGFSTNRKHPFITHLKKQLNKAGYSTLRFDFTGRGQSEGRVKDGLVSQYVNDLKNAIRLAAEHSKNLGLIGHSLGGTISLLNAKSKLVKAVISLSGVYSPQTTIKSYLKSNLLRRIQAVRVGLQFHKDFVKYDLQKTIKLNKKPLLIINGDRDRLVSVEQAIRMYDEASKPKAIKIIRNCGHNFWRPNHAKQVSDLAINWFKNYLPLN